MINTYTKILEDVIELRENYSGKCICHKSRVIYDNLNNSVFKLQLIEGEIYEYVIIDTQGHGRTYEVFTDKGYLMKPELFKEHLMDLKAYRDSQINNIIKDGI